MKNEEARNIKAKNTSRKSKSKGSESEENKKSEETETKNNSKAVNKKHENYGHRKRMYQKISFADNLDIFPEHELIEVLLYFIEPRKNTNGLAHKVKEFMGSLAKLKELDHKAIQAEFNFTERATAFWRILIYMLNYGRERAIVAYKDFSDKPLTKDYLMSLFKNEENEIFYAICLDHQYKMKNVIKIVNGSSENASILLKNLNRDLSFISPKYIVLAHNHPKGTLRPSIDDISTTKTIIEAFKPFGMNIIDHYIVSRGSCYSFKEHNVIFNKD